MKHFKTITTSIALGAMVLSTSAFAGENEGEGKKETSNVAYSKNLPAVGTCSLTHGANAGPDQTYFTGGCCTPPTIGGNPCATGNNNCGPCQKIYSWTPTSGLSNPNICNPTASPASTTNYTLTITFKCGDTLCPGGGSYSCCLDACDGGNRSCGGSPNCAGSPTATDVVKVTVNPNSCCRLLYPEKLPQIADKNINLYPNPNPGIFTVEVEEIKDNMSMHIYNVKGESVWSASTVQNKQDIDISNQSKGIYFVQIKAGKNIVLYQKIVVQ